MNMPKSVAAYQRSTLYFDRFSFRSKHGMSCCILPTKLFIRRDGKRVLLITVQCHLHHASNHHVQAEETPNPSVFLTIISKQSGIHRIVHVLKLRLSSLVDSKRQA